MKKFPWSANLYTAIITKIGLHDWNTYIAFTRVNKAMRRGVISCLPYQKSLLDQYRVSNEMHSLMKLDDLYHRRFDQKLQTIEAILNDIERLGVPTALEYFK